MRRATEAIHRAAAHPAVPGTAVVVAQIDLCPPMEDTPSSRRVFEAARKAASDYGLRLGAAATGGVGDANLIAGAGVPTLDGLGPVGGADHTPGEWLDTSSVPHRVAMLGCLIASLGSAGNDR
ncbi:M20/M25/M40 family metallo-hydrolase [Streptomyces sp. NPDC055893]